MKRCRPYLLLIVFICATTYRLSAQGKTSSIAKGGEHGIYIGVGIEPASKIHPLKGTTAYRVDRRKSKETAWKTIADVEGPATFDEFQARYRRCVQSLPPMPLFDEVPLRDVWAKYEVSWNIDSIGLVRALLPVQVAMGVVYFDSTAQQGITYVYRVSTVSSAGRVTPAYISTPVSFPESPRFARMRLTDRQYFSGKVNLEWTFDPGQRPLTFQAYRQDNMIGKFNPINPLMGMTRSGETMKFVLNDSLVDYGHVYKYILVPLDIVGNKGKAIDTVSVMTYDLTDVPLPEKITIQSLDSTAGLQLTWHLDRRVNLTSVRIFRSTDYDSGYVKIADIPSTDTAYVDRTITPMVKYYYYLVMAGSLGQLSPRSVRVIGIHKSAIRPLAPQIIKAEGLKNGVRLKWISREKGIDGYYVYRGSATGKELEQISPFIPKKDSVSAFIDTGKTLSGRFEYAYAVRSENASHLLSGYSDTVYVRPLIPLELSSPVNLSASEEEGTVRLYWENPLSTEQTIKGYEVYRRDVVPSGKYSEKFRKLTDTLLVSTQNRYMDKKIEEGKTYEYTVKAVDWFGGASPMSASVTVSLARSRPVPPAGVRAVKVKEGIAVQWDETVQKDIAAYNVYGYQRGKKPKLLGTVKKDQLQFIDKTARIGNLYFYYITTVNSKKVESHPSAEVGVRR